MIRALKVGFTSDFVPDCPFKLCFFKLWHRFSHWLYLILYYFLCH